MHIHVETGAFLAHVHVRVHACECLVRQCVGVCTGDWCAACPQCALLTRLWRWYMRPHQSCTHTSSITDVGAEALYNALLKNQYCRKINLADNNISPEWQKKLLSLNGLLPGLVRAHARTHMRAHQHMIMINRS